MLFWNWQISWRATIPGWYFWGLFNMPAFKNSFLGALPPTVSWGFFLAGPSPADINGPASVAICASCLVGDDPGNCATSSSFLISSLHLPTLPGVGGLRCHMKLLCLHFWLCWGLHSCSDLLPCPPTSRCDLGPHYSGVKINQSDVLVGFSEDVGHFFPFTQRAQRFQVLFYKWEMSGSTLHTFWRGRRRSFRQP